MTEKLGAFRPSVVHECFNILIQAIHCVFHLAIPFFRTFEARLKIQVFLVYSLISGIHSRALSRYTFVLALLRSDSLVL
jgi:hypothetical protein